MPNSEQASIKTLRARIAEARSSGIQVVETFAVSREQDGATVRVALTQPWSSGQAEGHTRLKLLKRSIYGRARFDFLRRRVLLAA
ncbi:transposase (plasmid) [Microvirga sp. VF16]|nr:transposase [Microvirga sp. VF16]